MSSDPNYYRGLEDVVDLDNMTPAEASIMASRDAIRMIADLTDRKEEKPNENA